MHIERNTSVTLLSSKNMGSSNKNRTANYYTATFRQEMLFLTLISDHVEILTYLEVATSVSIIHISVSTDFILCHYVKAGVER